MTHPGEAEPDADLPPRAAEIAARLAEAERVTEYMARRAQRIAKDTGMVGDLVLQALAAVYKGTARQENPARADHGGVSTKGADQTTSSGVPRDC